jgi:hypothetical protein
MSDEDDRKAKARGIAKGLNAGANIAKTIADMSPAAAYRNVNFKATPVAANDKDHAAAMSPTTEYDGKQQTAVSEDNGIGSDGKPILSKKEQRLLQRQRNYDNFQ